MRLPIAALTPLLRMQGTGTTALGTHSLLSAFGTHPRREAGALPYRVIGRGDHWVQDDASPFHNRYRNRRHDGLRWWLAPRPFVRALVRRLDPAAAPVTAIGR